MAEHILFLTGKLAEKQLRQVLAEMEPEFRYTVHQLGLTVAALMTADMIHRRLKDTFGAQRVLVPGRCRGDLEALSLHLGIPVQRGPEELRTCRTSSARKRRSRPSTATTCSSSPKSSMRRGWTSTPSSASAQDYRRHGADVIDLGCLPDDALRAPGGRRADPEAGRLPRQRRLGGHEELLRGGRAGADYLLSLHEDTLWIADEVAATPVLIARAPRRRGVAVSRPSTR